MNNLCYPKVSTDGSMLLKARGQACCLLALVFAFASGAGSTHAQVRPPVLQQQQRQSQSQQAATQQDTSADKDDDDDKDESESTGRPSDVFVRPQITDPATILRKAHFIYVRPDSIFISGDEVEDSLRKRKEFQSWGMVITRSEAEADLIIEITRKPFTRRFTFTVIDPRTMEVVTSGKTRSVIFGKKIANKVAEKFANRVKVYRPYKG
ncbi:MAG: hypothetical protein QOE46_2331 [Acidobacteriota bacterium]|nr:hypothetical protein [Acidobacteriota bacterium]